MKKTTTLLALAATAVSANAALVQWQTEVGNGTTASATNFSTVSGAAHQTIDVQTTAGTAQSFEFIVNSSAAGAAQTLLGDRNAGGSNAQALRFEQYNNTGNYGITAYGSFDFNSGVAHTTNTDIHILFTTNGVNLSTIYVNGTSVATTTNLIDISGITGLAATNNTGGAAQDALSGSILGFAAYDSELSAAEALTHANAFASAAVPEPSSTALLGLGGLALILRRRK